MKKRYNQLVLVEFHNCSPFVYQMSSNRRITLSRVVAYFIRTEGFDEGRDAITLIDQPTQIIL